MLSAAVTIRGGVSDKLGKQRWQCTVKDPRWGDGNSGKKAPGAQVLWQSASMANWPAKSRDGVGRSKAEFCACVLKAASLFRQAINGRWMFAREE